MKRIINKFDPILNIAPSIKGKLFITYTVIIILMLVPIVISFVSTRSLSLKYDKLIGNVNYANELNSIVKKDINAEMWNIVSGKTSFEQGRQFEILYDINNRLDVLHKNVTTEENRQKIVVVKRTMLTLSNYVYQLGDQMRANSKVYENEATLEVIREVSSLADDILEEFIVNEIRSVGAVNENLKQSAKMTTAIELVTLFTVIIFAILALLSVTGNVKQSIDELEVFASKIADGDLDARAKPTTLTELTDLTNSLNSMANQILTLIQENIQKQKNLQKSEMRALQAQITPHFLYNTFDTIIWLAEGEQNKEVIDVTLALSNFFRISLSQGKEWIKVEKEIEHIQSYLTIQKMRYGNILNYTIDVDKAIINGVMLKLLLQPLVENAIYHGIKNSRNRGHITVTGVLKDGKMFFSVHDNGMGMTPERLSHVQQRIGKLSDSSYGMYNVNKRIRIYYDVDKDISIESDYGLGTTISFSIPFNEVSDDVGV